MPALKTWTSLQRVLLGWSLEGVEAIMCVQFKVGIYERALQGLKEAISIMWSQHEEDESGHQVGGPAHCYAVRHQGKEYRDVIMIPRS